MCFAESICLVLNGCLLVPSVFRSPSCDLRIAGQATCVYVSSSVICNCLPCSFPCYLFRVLPCFIWVVHNTCTVYVVGAVLNHLGMLRICCVCLFAFQFILLCSHLVCFVLFCIANSTWQAFEGDEPSATLLCLVSLLCLLCNNPFPLSCVAMFRFMIFFIFVTRICTG